MAHALREDHPLFNPAPPDVRLDDWNQNAQTVRRSSSFIPMPRKIRELFAGYPLRLTRAIFLTAAMVSGALLPSSIMMAHAAEETAQAADEAVDDRVETVDDYKKKLEAHREANRLELKDYYEAANTNRGNLWIEIGVPLALFLLVLIATYFFNFRFVRKLTAQLNDEQTRRLDRIIELLEAQEKRAKD
jgi:hypothetical protein